MSFPGHRHLPAPSVHCAAIVRISQEDVNQASSPNTLSKTLILPPVVPQGTIRTQSTDGLGPDHLGGGIWSHGFQSQRVPDRRSLLLARVVLAVHCPVPYTGVWPGEPPEPPDQNLWDSTEWSHVQGY